MLHSRIILCFSIDALRLLKPARRRRGEIASRVFGMFACEKGELVVAALGYEEEFARKSARVAIG